MDPALTIFIGKKTTIATSKCKAHRRRWCQSNLLRLESHVSRRLSLRV